VYCRAAVETFVYEELFQDSKFRDVFRSLFREVLMEFNPTPDIVGQVQLENTLKELVKLSCDTREKEKLVIRINGETLIVARESAMEKHNALHWIKRKFFTNHSQRRTQISKKEMMNLMISNHNGTNISLEVPFKYQSQSIFSEI
jgi:hypothetical protein